MTEKLKLILILAIVVQNSQCEMTTGLSSITEIRSTLEDIASMIGKVVATYKKHNPHLSSPQIERHLDKLPINKSEKVADPSVANQNIKIERTVRRMMSKVRKITNTMPKYTESITDTLDFMLEVIIEKLEIPETSLQVISNSLERIHKYSTIIDRYYGDFIKFSQPKLKIAPSTIAELAASTIAYKENQLIMSVSSVRGCFEPRESSPIYEALMNYFSESKSIPYHKICDSALSVQEEIKTIYNLVMVNEMRAFMMITFSYKYQELMHSITEFNNSIFTLLMSQTLERMSQYLLAIKRITETASREKLRCDPKELYLDINCFRLNNLFGLYYLNERQVSTKCGLPSIKPQNPVVVPKVSNPGHNTESTEFVSRPRLNMMDTMRHKRDIESMTVVRNKVACLDMSSYSQNLLVPVYCPQENTQCNGVLHNCKVVPKVSFCEADEGYGRRYQWINNEANDIPSINCTGNFVDTMTVAKCNSFLCQCSEQGAKSSATRAVSLMSQMADIENNMVVTNVRFQKKDNMVHLQIKQGRLLPEGKIENLTISWVPLPDLVYKHNVPEGSFWRNHDTGVSPLIYEMDYTFLTHDRTTVNLDDVTSSPGYVITGARLNFLEESSKGSAGPLELQVHVTPYDYHRGQLEPTSDHPSKWISARRTYEVSYAYQFSRREVNLSKSDDSLKNVKNEVLSGPNRFVNFQVTDYEKDFGQITIPYFDSRAAAVASLSALNGMGIFHRGAEGQGGFLALKVINVNHNHFIHYKLHQNQFDYSTNY